ncbi:MAG TPA: hypothetical protein VFD43_09095 [Planctomycetota bacterium]|nr:hypothetical protein [Planctomycetota bacterium]
MSDATHPLVSREDRTVYLNGAPLLTFIAKAEARACEAELIAALDACLGPDLLARLRELRTFEGTA